LDGFSLANQAKFAKLSPCQTFLLYGTSPEVMVNSIRAMHLAE